MTRWRTACRPRGTSWPGTCPATPSSAGEDLTAAGALKALLRDGVAVPGQVAVTGYNNSAYAYLCEPVLTTVDNKGEQAASCAYSCWGAASKKAVPPPP